MCVWGGGGGGLTHSLAVIETFVLGSWASLLSWLFICCSLSISGISVRWQGTVQLSKNRFLCRSDVHGD